MSNAAVIELPAIDAVRAAVPSWAGAEPLLAELLSAGVPMAHALTRFGIRLLEQLRIADAVIACRAAVALLPSESTFWANYGCALDRADALEDATASLERSLELAPDQPATWLLLGLVSKKRGDVAGAERAYLTALAQQPDSAVVLHCLGMLKEEQRDHVAALAYFSAQIERGDTSAGALLNVARLCYQIGRYADACEGYERAAQADPANLACRDGLRKSRFLRDVIAGEALDSVLARYRSSFAPPEQYVEQDLIDMFEFAVRSLTGYGHIEAATCVGRKQLELWPSDRAAAYTLDALTGNASLTRASPEYIRARFDGFAERFDSQLVDVLGYDVPRQIAAAIEATPVAVLRDGLDLGCGTGLCGREIRRFVQTLAGVDLSSKMLERAAKRGVYGDLTCEEIVVYLERSTSQYDLIAAADVVIYFGDLAPLLGAVARVLRPGGIFVFSTESHRGAGYRLQTSGRFAHAGRYVNQIASEVGLLRQSQRATTIRTECSRPVAGDLFVFQRPSAQRPSLWPPDASA